MTNLHKQTHSFVSQFTARKKDKHVIVRLGVGSDLNRGQTQEHAQCTRTRSPAAKISRANFIETIAKPLLHVKKLNDRDKFAKVKRSTANGMFSF